MLFEFYRVYRFGRGFLGELDEVLPDGFDCVVDFDEFGVIGERCVFEAGGAVVADVFAAYEFVVDFCYVVVESEALFDGDECLVGVDGDFLSYFVGSCYMDFFHSDYSFYF